MFFGMLFSKSSCLTIQTLLVIIYLISNASLKSIHIACFLYERYVLSYLLCFLLQISYKGIFVFPLHCLHRISCFWPYTELIKKYFTMKAIDYTRLISVFAYQLLFINCIYILCVYICTYVRYVYVCVFY